MNSHQETYSDWADRLLVGILEYEEITGSSNADLSSVCESFGIDKKDDWLVRFLNENRDVLGNGVGFLSLYSFSLNSDGREKAKRLRKDRLPKTWVERLTGDTSQKLINVGNFALACLALVIAAVALWKSS